MQDRWAALISGGGTTASAMIEACYSGAVPLEVGCVLASTPDAGGIEKARALGVPEKNIVVVNPRDFRGDDGRVDQDKFGRQILEELQHRDITLVTQNGWLPQTPEVVIRAFPDAIFNQHPGPLPEFGGKGMYGRRVHAAVLLFQRITGRESWTEVVAQRVAPEYDRGVVVGSQRVEILRDDTVDDLQRRALPREHELQIGLLQDFVARRVSEVSSRATLVGKGQEEQLVLAKRMARILYPKG